MSFSLEEILEEFAEASSNGKPEFYVGFRIIDREQWKQNRRERAAWRTPLAKQKARQAYARRVSTIAGRAAVRLRGRRYYHHRRKHDPELKALKALYWQRFYQCRKDDPAFKARRALSKRLKRLALRPRYSRNTINHKEDKP